MIEMKSGRNTFLRVDKEKEKDQEKEALDDKKTIIIAKIDNIYMNIKEEPFYFKKLKFLLFLVFVVNYSFFWLIYNFVAPLKNNYYCYDFYSFEFKLCEQDDFCSNSHNGIKRFIFTDSPEIANIDTFEETKNIQEKFFSFFFKEAVIFNTNNAKYLNKNSEISSLYTVVIAVTKNEKWNIFNTFHQYCNRQKLLSQIGIFALVSMIFGNIIFAFMADLMGRKKVLVFVCFLQVIGCIMIFLFGFYVTRSGTSNGQPYQSKYKSFTEDFKNDPVIKSYITLNRISVFNVQDINTKYDEVFNEVQQYIIDSRIINSNFNRLKIIFYIGLFFVITGTGNSYYIALSLLLENSINDTVLYSNYQFYHIGMPTSLILSFTLITKLDNFYYTYLVLGVLLFIITILLITLTYESPRFNYEFHRYTEITNTFLNILKREEVDKFLKSEKDNKFSKEIKKNNQMRKESFCYTFTHRIFFLGCHQKLKYFKKKQQENSNMNITNKDFFKGPVLLSIILYNNKHVKQHFLITIALIANISLIFFLTINKFNSELVYSRSDMYNNYIVNTYVFLLAVIMALSVYFFSFILKFFGYNIILFICFFMVFIFSIVYELLILAPIEPEDLNSFSFNSVKNAFVGRRSSLIAMLCLVTFFSTGLMFTLYFYLTKLSKTLYRCTLFGMCFCIIDFMIFFAIAISQYFEKNFFYVALISLIGFVNSYFVVDDEFFTIVDDYRQIELVGDES